jgi:thiosulfate/3-mercaptopyruvate sulfurtransferase
MTLSRQQPDATVDVPWIVTHVGDPRVRLVEVDVSRAAYDQGHIPGATLWDAYADLRDPAYRPVSPPELQRLLSRSGITAETTIVLYGYAAPLGFWLMKAHGHGDVRMLIGSRDQWVEAGERWTTEVPQPEESPYPLPREDEDILAPRQAVEAAIGEPGQVIIDVRSKPEYTGERFWPTGATADTGRSGHVPGAVSIPIDSLRAENGAPKSVEELRRTFENAGVTKDKAVITYCTIGNRASEAWFALKYELDYPRARVYYDSWAVWGKLTHTPVEA